MLILKLFAKGFLLLTTSAFIFTGLMFFTDAFGLDVMPAVIHLAWSRSWWATVLTSSLMVGIGVACGVLLRYLTKRWNNELI